MLSSLTARGRFTQIIRRAKEGDQRFVVSEKGEPQVVIMGVKDFLLNIAPDEPVLAEIRSRAKKTGKSKLSLKQINREIKAYRKQKKSNDATTRRRP